MLFRAGDPHDIWGFPKIRGTILGVPIIRIIVYSILGSRLGSPHLGNYHLFCTWKDSYSMGIEGYNRVFYRDNGKENGNYYLAIGTCDLVSLRGNRAYGQGL